MWLRLWSHARYDLRLTDEEFYDLTPRQIDALSQRHNRRTEEMEFLFGQLTAYVINFSHPRLLPKEAAQAKDFMPSQMRKQMAEKKPRTRRQIADEFRAVMASYLVKR